MLISGMLGVVSMLFISLHSKLQLVFAILALTAGNLAGAVADVTVDACVAQNSISHPSRAADMQSLCTLSYSFGGLLGFSISGVFIHLIGPKVGFCLIFLVEFCYISSFFKGFSFALLPNDLSAIQAKDLSCSLAGGVRIADSSRCTYIFSWDSAFRAPSVQLCLQ